MTERCEVLVSGRTDAAVALAQELRAYGVDVRLADPDVRTATVTTGSEAIHSTLRDGAEQLDVTASFLVGDGDRAGRDGRQLWMHDPTDARNLAWKLASVLGGAADMLLDTYVTERAERPKDYRASPLSQRLGGRKVRIPPGLPIPDDLVLWSRATNRDVRLWPSRRWVVLGLGTVGAPTVRAVSERFGDRVNAQVIGGGNAQSEQVTLLDRYGHCNRRLAKRGGSVLAVRPDRYVGLQSAPDPEIVLAYLEDLIPESNPEGTATAPESFSI